MREGETERPRDRESEREPERDGGTHMCGHTLEFSFYRKAVDELSDDFDRWASRATVSVHAQ